MPLPRLLAVKAGEEGCVGCECPPPVLRRVRFQKLWYGYYGFDVDGDSIIEQVYRTFSVTRRPKIGDDIYFVTLTVSFNRLNGHITASLDTDWPGDVNDVWPDTTFASLPPATDPGVTETSVNFEDYDGAGADMDWTLSDPYTMTELASDLDTLVDLYEAGDPDTDAEGDDSRVRYNELDYYACDEGLFTDPPCIFPYFGSSYAPHSQANYDLIGTALSPAVVIDDGITPATGMHAKNAFNHAVDGIWYQAIWMKSKLRVVNIVSERCLTTDVNSSFETPADVCAFPAATAGVVLLNPPDNRALDQFTTTGFSEITATLCMPCNLTGGDCPCDPV